MPTAHDAQNWLITNAGWLGSSSFAYSGSAMLCDAEPNASPPRTTTMNPSTGPNADSSDNLGRAAAAADELALVRSRTRNNAAADTRNDAAFSQNAAANPPNATTSPADAKPSTVPHARPLTSDPFARTRASAPTISGTLLRSATVNRVFPAPSTTAAHTSTDTAGALTASTTMADACARSVPIISRRRSNRFTSRPAARPATNPAASRNAITMPTPSGPPVTSSVYSASATRFR